MNILAELRVGFCELNVYALVGLKNLDADGLAILDKLHANAGVDLLDAGAVQHGRTDKKYDDGGNYPDERATQKLFDIHRINLPVA